jgi:hypothetical protein
MGWAMLRPYTYDAVGNLLSVAVAGALAYKTTQGCFVCSKELYSCLQDE